MTSDTSGVRLRFATVDDVPLILGFIRALAAYERLAHEVVADEERLRATLFGPRPAAEVLLASDDEGPPRGFALFFTSYSTFLAQPGLYLEDLFVEPTARGRGLGLALMAALARLALERGYGRFEWSVLDWNQPAIDFYRALGAKPMDEWTVYRLAGKTLEDVAAMATLPAA